MDKPDLKTAAESALRDLPAVVGVFVVPDALGGLREIHLLIRSGPRPREFAEHVKSLLEDRLRIPIDQRVISIAQIAADAERTVAGAEPDASPAPQHRVRLERIESSTTGDRITVTARLVMNEERFDGEATELESDSGRGRAAARAVLAAINRVAGETGWFSLDFATAVPALNHRYAVVSATLASARLGRRRSERVVGAHPVEDQSETAAALATLKAVNRLLRLVLDRRTDRARPRPPRVTR